MNIIKLCDSCCDNQEFLLVMLSLVVCETAASALPGLAASQKCRWNCLPNRAVWLKGDTWVSCARGLGEVILGTVLCMSRGSGVLDV